MKDVAVCDKPRGADKQALIRGCPNGETHPAIKSFCDLMAGRRQKTEDGRQINVHREAVLLKVCHQSSVISRLRRLNLNDPWNDYGRVI